MTRPAVVLFTRDLRVRDNVALWSAVSSGRPIVPLFVVDDAVRGLDAAPNRAQFLCDCLGDLDASLQQRGAALVVRRGAWVHETMKVVGESDADVVYVMDDFSAFAKRRLEQLEAACTAARVDVQRCSGAAVVDPGTLTPGPGGHFKVFTPFYRRWSQHGWRDIAPTPRRIDGFATALASHEWDSLRPDAALCSKDLAVGGESAGTKLLQSWARANLGRYADIHDDLAQDATSRIASYLHFGALSPLEVATRLRDRAGAEAYVRQLCWRDFYLQALADRPDAARRDYRSRGDMWNVDPAGLDAWMHGRTGYPIVDAAMRQLRAEGFMHNRARMIVASFLTKDLYIDWRLGAAHFMRWLADADVANNQLNWQWVAGTGADTNPHRIFNPLRQAERFDPSGDYTRRYLPELAHLDAKSIRDPDPAMRAECGYPLPIVDHREAIARYRTRLAEQRDQQR